MLAEATISRLKRKLHIPAEVVDFDARINDIAGAAGPHVRDMLGCPASYDFTEAGLESAIFDAYCFYEFNDSMDEFYGNYAMEIQSCREKYAALAASADA